MGSVGDHIDMIGKSKSHSGQTIVEFALILLLLLIVIFGIIEFAIILYDQAILTSGCREGARSAVVYRANAANFDYAPLTENEIRTIIGNYYQNQLVTFGEPFDPATDVQVEYDPSPATRGGNIEVRVNFTYTYFALPRMLNLGGGTLDLSSRTIMRME